MGESRRIYQQPSGRQLLLGEYFRNAIISDRAVSHRKVQFEKHVQGDVPPQAGAGRIDFFTSGGLKSTPSLEEISTDWPAPWIFIRVLGLSLLMCIGFLGMFSAFGDRAMNAAPGLLFAISFAVPFSVLTLFAEFNVRRNISWYSIIVLVLRWRNLVFDCYIHFERSFR